MAAGPVTKLQGPAIDGRGTRVDIRAGKKQCAAACLGQATVATKDAGKEGITRAADGHAYQLPETLPPIVREELELLVQVAPLQVDWDRNGHCPLGRRTIDGL